MNWRLLTWKNIAGLLVTAMIVGTLVCLFVVYPGGIRGRNFGFGPEWSCTYIPNSDPVCVKKTLSNENPAR
jgi:hypothetical protein